MRKLGNGVRKFVYLRNEIYYSFNIFNLKILLILIINIRIK